MKLPPEIFENAFGITKADYKTECRGLTWKEVTVRASEAVNHHGAKDAWKTERLLKELVALRLELLDINKHCCEPFTGPKWSNYIEEVSRLALNRIEEILGEKK